MTSAERGNELLSMKIALVKRRCSLRHGGSERYCVNLARRLQAAGHPVTVIGAHIDEELAGEIDFLRVSVNRLTSWTSNRSFAESAGRAAARGGFDVVYGLGRALGVDAVRVTERLQSHWLHVRYGPHFFRRLQEFNPRHRALIGLERTIYRSGSVRRVVTQSQLDRRLLIEHYGVAEEKVQTIYNGVDTGVFHPGVRERAADVRSEFGLDGEPLLVFASMDFAGKGLRSILEALRLTRDREARLLVLGEGPVARFRRIARRLGVEQRVIFGGRRGDIQKYYGTADLFLLPSAYEPFPNVNLEAMACGTPVVTTRTNGGADIVREGENGYLISETRAVGELAERLNYHLALSSARRSAMSAACWETARHMTLERNMRETLTVFEEVLHEKRSERPGRFRASRSLPGSVQQGAA